LAIIEVGLKLRTHQQYLSAFARRFNVNVCHRRFGKTLYEVDKILKKGFQNPLENPQYVYVGPTFTQTKRVVWDVFKQLVKPFPSFETNESDLRITIPRPQGDVLKIVLLGAENPNSIRGMYIDGCVLDEAQEQNPEVWTKVIRPALSDRNGWADIIGTPKGAGFFHDMYLYAKARMEDPDSEWAAFLFSADKTGIIPEKELKAMREEMTPDAYAQELLCDFTAALQGAFYAKTLAKLQEKNQITKVPYDPAIPVYTAWDLGMSDATSIWFIQPFRDTYRVIDYYANSGMGLDHYAKILKEKPYAYDEHMFPHDVTVRELGTGVSRIETLRTLGLKVTVAPKQKLEDGINAVRNVLPKCWFDSIACEAGLKGLWNYQRSYDVKTDTWSNKPDHTWASHPADAFRTFAVCLRTIGRGDRTKDLPRKSNYQYNVLD